MIEIGDKVRVKSSKTVKKELHGVEVKVTGIHVGHKPVLYTVDLPNGKQGALYETEIEPCN